MFNENNSKEILSIPDILFFKPSEQNKITTKWINQHLETPIGVAAGPHSQMAQNN